MTELEIVKWIVFSLLGFAVWFMKRTIDHIESKQDEMQREQSKIKEEYLHKNDFKEFKLELRSMFEEIRTDIRDLKK